MYQAMYRLAPKVQRVTVSRGCLIMYLLRSEGHLSGCDTGRRCLTAWQGAHAAGGRAAVGSRPRQENQSSRAGILGPWLAGRRIPRSVSRRHTYWDMLPARQVPTWTGYAPLRLVYHSTASCTCIRAPTRWWWPSGCSTEAGRLGLEG